MIAAPDDLVALYRVENDGQAYTDQRDIVAIDDDGMPWIVPDKSPNRGLVPADHYRNYVGLGRSSVSRVVSLLPAGGWRVEWTGDDGTTWSQPLVGWGLKANGDVVLLDADAEGLVEELDYRVKGWRIYHPDAAGTS